MERAPRSNLRLNYHPRLAKHLLRKPLFDPVAISQNVPLVILNGDKPPARAFAVFHPYHGIRAVNEQPVSGI